MTAAFAALPEVRLEVRRGAGRTASYALDHVDFLIGAVPGCDLRVPGAELPPVLCLIARQPGGARLRKLAPTQVLLVNGQTTAGLDLNDGDRITLGAIDIFVHIQQSSAVVASAPPAANESKQELQKQLQTFRGQVVRFNEEREAFALEKKRQQEELQHREQQISHAAAGATEVAEKMAEIEHQRQELAAQRQELADIRKQLYDRYQERRDRLAGLQEAVNKAAAKVQESKRQLDADAQVLAGERTLHTRRDAELEQRAAELSAERQQLEQERQRLEECQAELPVREEKLADAQRDLAIRRQQYDADVLRLDRRQGALERREQELEAKNAQVDGQLQQLKRDGVELENQAAQLDELRAALADENERLIRQKQEQDAAAVQLSQRAAVLEGQQATLAALRTRLERMRDDVRRQEQQLEEQRSRQETVEVELEQQSQALQRLKDEIDNEDKIRAQEREQLAERSATLDAAVAQLRQAREQLSAQEERLRQRLADLDQRQAGLADQEGVLQGRLHQLGEAQQRVDAERQALRERTLAQTQAEQAREALQEQLRRRSEELAVRQKTLNDQIQEYQTKTAALDDRRGQLDEAHQSALTQVEVRRQELTQQAEALEKQKAELHELETKHQAQQRQLQEMGRTVADQQQALAQQQSDNQRAWQEKQEQHAQSRADFDGLRQEAKKLVQELPEAELRAGTALDRVSLAREQLRDHVAEIHAYVRQCQEELEGVRAKLQADVAALGQHEQALRRGQDEHRLALVAFRQQIIDWQGQIGDLKRQLARGETKLERRQAKMDEQVRELDAAAQRLAVQSESLGQQQHAVAAERDELDRHLAEMRQWYRRKLRDLAGIAVAPAPVADAPGSPPSEEELDALVPTQRDILSITEPMDAGDRKLGETLAGLQLIDDETLTALLMEARRQRRSLRQVLLASGVVTLYQLALIEAGNIAGLMLGPARVIDRLRVTPHEIVYRVFDPRRGQESVLRHLAEEEQANAVHVGEFRKCFGRAMMQDPHLAATYEVLDLNGRPAALQEWLAGLPASDWPPLAAAPGVCFRLVTQAALGLGTIHKAGLVHGHLDDSSLLLTGAGIVKICGLGEPAWLTGKTSTANPEPRDDLHALGRIAAGWCLADGVRKGAKTKPLPGALQAILERLADKGAGGYTTAQELLDDLDRTGADVPPNAEAWDRLLKYVREHETPEAVLRLSA